MKTQLEYFSEKIEDYKKSIQEVERTYEKAFPSPLKTNIPGEKEWKIIRKHYFNIQLHLTNRCNTFCKVCITNSSPQEIDENELTLEDIKFILRKVGKNKKITLFGGEPTVRDDIFDIIKLIKKSGNIVELFTNGLLLSNINYVRKLKNAGIDMVCLSFSGFDEKFYEEIYGSKHELKFRFAALKNLEKEKIPTYITCIIAKNLNENEIPRLIKTVRDSVANGGSLRGIKFYALSPVGRFIAKKSYILTTPELIEVLERKTNGEINLEYLLEFKKFIINVKRFLARFDIIFPSFLELRGFYKLGSLKEFPPRDVLKELNKNFENKNILKNIRKLIKNLLPILLNLNFVKLREKIVEKEKLIEISVGNVLSTLEIWNYPYAPSIEIRKRYGIPIVNFYFSFAASDQI